MVIKLLFKAAIILALAFAGLSYLTYVKTGKFILPTNFKKPNISAPKLPSLDKKKVSYKWKDQDGNWQYTTELPTGGVPYETIDAIPR